MGDATNMVIIFAGELLKKAESLLVMGLHPSEVIKGYELALDKTLRELESTSFRPTFDSLSSDVSMTSSIDMEIAATPDTRLAGDRTQARDRCKTIRS